MSDKAETDEVFRFTARYYQDLGDGKTRTLDEYLALFPAFPELIRQEFQKLRNPSPVERTVTPTPAEAEPTQPTTNGGGESIGPYRILSELGRGGQGVVYLAEDQRLHRRVALKVLRGFGAESESMRTRLAREAAAASKLDDAGICTVFEVGEADGIPFIAMRYVDGQPLSKVIATARADAGLHDEPSSTTSTGPESRGELMDAVARIEKVARSLHVAHEAGLVHRDIKPGNIMVTKEDEPVILDFGLVHDEASTEHTLTRSGDVLGTPVYMSPEQLSGDHRRVDRRTDVYSLGATLYECLTLRRPFEAPTLDRLYQKILSTSATAAHRLNSRIPRDLEVVLQTALEKDRDRRYQTALDLAEDLERIRTLKPIHARPTPLPLRMKRWVQRNPAAAAIMVLVTVGLVTTFWLLQQTEEALRKQRLLGLVAESEKALATDPMLALLLAREAVRNEVTWETTSQLQRVLAQPQPTAILTSSKKVNWLRAVIAEESGRVAAIAPVASGEGSHSLALFDASGEELSTFTAKTPIRDLRISPSGHRIAILLWNQRGPAGVEFRDDKGKLLQAIDQVCNFERAAKPGDGVLVFSRHGEVTRFDWNGNKTAELMTTQDAVSAVCRRGKTLVLGSVNGSLELRDASGKLRETRRTGQWPESVDYCPKNDVVVVGHRDAWLPAPSGKVVVNKKKKQRLIISSMHGRFALSPRGDRLLTIDPPEAGKAVPTTARLHDLGQTFKPRAITKSGRPTSLVVYWNSVEPFGFSPNGDEFFTCHSDGTLAVWDSDGTPIRQLPGVGTPRACYSPDGTHLAVVRSEGATLYDAAGEEVLALRTPQELQGTPVFAPDGKSVLTLGRSIYRWNLFDEVLPTYRGHGNSVPYVAVSRNGVVATGTDREGVCRVWKKPGTEPEILAPESAFANALWNVFVEFSPDGNWLLRGSESYYDPAPRLRNMSTEATIKLEAPDWPPEQPDPRIGPKTAIWDACFSSDGTRIVIGCDPKGTVRVWDGNGVFRELFRVPEESSPAPGFTYGVDTRGDLVLTAHGDGVCRLWKMKGEGESTPIKEFSTGIQGITANCAHFLPDGKSFVAGYNDETLRIWTLDGSEPPRDLPEAKAFQLRVSPLGDRIATVAQDGARILDLNGRVLAELRGHKDRVTSLRFTTPDGKKLLTGSADRTVRTWFVYTKDLLEHADEKVKRALTPTERERYAPLLESGSAQER